MQTPIVRAEPGKDLKLESPTRSLEIQASQNIFIQSRAGKNKDIISVKLIDPIFK